MRVKFNLLTIILILVAAWNHRASAQLPAVIDGPVVNLQNGHTYYLLDYSSWSDAEAAAVTLGGHLATIDDSDENEWVYTNFSSFNGINSFLWIGFTDEAQEGTFIWSSGDAVTYTQWWPGEPNNSGGAENWAYIDTPDSPRARFWNDGSESPVDGNGHNPRGVVEVVSLEPIIVSDPTNQTVISGNDTSLTVIAGGLGNQYQWWFSTPIDGATNSTLFLTNVQSGATGSYFVIVTNAFGSATSAPAMLTVTNEKPFIIVQPVDIFVSPGSNATLNVTADGSKPMTFQWRLNGTDLLDATNPAYMAFMVQSNQAGLYSVVVSNAFGSVLSSNAMLSLGGFGSLSDNFDSGIDFPQWGSFGGTVLATNYGGFVSAPASLWFGGNGSRFAMTRPLDTLGDTEIDFALHLSGGGPLNWERVDLPDKGIVFEYSTDGGTDWTELSRYDSSDYYSWQTVSVTLPDEAHTPFTLFRWRQLANSGGGFDNWALDDVYIGPPQSPLITMQPDDFATQDGEDAFFSVTAIGSGDLQYQWQFNGGDIDEHASFLIVENVDPSYAGEYRVRVSNAFGTIYSSNAMLTVTGVPPMIITQPANESALLGEPTSFNVAVAGSGSLQYQWLYSSTNIDGATFNPFDFEPDELNQSGYYSVVVTNVYGSTTSAPALLTLGVVSLPKVIDGPIMNPANGHYYYLLSGSRWSEAEAMAVLMGGHLVTINDTNEEEWVYDTFSSFGGTNSYLWIGYTDHAHEGQFTWTSGESTDYSNWFPGEPSNSGGIENFVFIDTPDTERRDTWNDVQNDYDSEHPPRGVVELIVPWNPSPNLEIFDSGTNALVRWSIIASDFTLQTGHLGAVPPDWTDQLVPTSTNGVYIEALWPAQLQNEFFRLRHP